MNSLILEKLDKGFYSEVISAFVLVLGLLVIVGCLFGG